MFLLLTPVAEPEAVDRISRECQDAAINVRAAGARAGLGRQLGFPGSWKTGKSEAVAVPAGQRSHRRREGTHAPRVRRVWGWVSGSVFRHQR